MRKAILVGFLSLFATQASAHHAECSKIAGTEYLSCGAHVEGEEMNLIITDKAVTTNTKSGILCVGKEKKFAKIEMNWIEYQHDDYQGPIPQQPIIKTVAFLPLSDSCSILQNIDFSLPGAWSVNVTFADQAEGTFFVEVEKAPDAVVTPVVE